MTNFEDKKPRKGCKDVFNAYMVNEATFTGNSIYPYV